MIVGPDVTFHLDDSTEETFEKLKCDLEYTGVGVRKKKHRFGQLIWWIKASAFLEGVYYKEKYTPLASYKQHCLAKHLSLCSRAISWMLRQVVKPDEVFSVCSSRGVLKGVNRLNSATANLVKAGWECKFWAEKYDIDGFFNAIPHWKLRQSWWWLKSKWLNEKGTRRQAIVIPKQRRSAFVDRSSSYEKTFKYEVRRITRMINEPQPRCAPTAKGVDKKFLLCIHLEDIQKLVFADVFEHGFVRCGTSLFRALGCGIAQGSPLSPALADMTLMNVECINVERFLGAERQISEQQVWLQWRRCTLR